MWMAWIARDFLECSLNHHTVFNLVHVLLSGIPRTKYFRILKSWTSNMSFFQLVTYLLSKKIIYNCIISQKDCNGIFFARYPWRLIVCYLKAKKAMLLHTTRLICLPKLFKVCIVSALELNSSNSYIFLYSHNSHSRHFQQFQAVWFVIGTDNFKRWEQIVNAL